jgi:PAS domain S-box-containing protein
MKTHDAELQRIKDLLRGNPKGIKITRIAQTLGMNRNAAAKYLEILLMTGQVEVLEHGMSRIFILSRRTGIPTMLDGSSDMILVLDHEMRISRVNDNYTRFTGMRPEDLLGKRADVCVLPVIGNSRVMDRIRQARFGEDARTETKEAGGDGRDRYFDVRMTPAIFNDGTRGITISIGDITREKRLQETAADESRKLVEGILGCIDEAVVLIDARTSTISFLNPAARQLFGYGQDDYAGKNTGLLAGGTGTIPGCTANVEDAFRRQGYFEAESRMRRSDGGEFPAGLQLRPVFDAGGGVRHIVMVIRDMTVRTAAGKGVLNSVQEPAIPVLSGIFPAGNRRHNSAI